jgi:hypothetical protein
MFEVRRPVAAFLSPRSGFSYSLFCSAKVEPESEKSASSGISRALAADQPAVSG